MKKKKENTKLDQVFIPKSMKPKSTSITPLNLSVNIAGSDLKMLEGGTNHGALSIPPIVHQNGDASSFNGTTLTTAASLWPTLDSCFI